MKKFSLHSPKIFLIFSIIALSSISTQSQIYLSGTGGVNYIPMKSFAHFLNSLSNSKIDVIGFNGELGLRYSFSDRHNVNLNLGIINKNASWSGGFSGANWNIRIFPIAVGYSYIFGNKVEDPILTHVGINISLNFIQIDEKSYTDTGGFNPDGFYKMHRYGFTPFVDLTYKLYEDLSLFTKFEYKYLNDVELWSQELNLSGFIFNMGLQVKLFNVLSTQN